MCRSWLLDVTVPAARVLSLVGGTRRTERVVRRGVGRGQTGYSQPIPKAGIGGSPRFAARAPIGIFEGGWCILHQCLGPKGNPRLSHSEEGNHMFRNATHLFFMAVGCPVLGPAPD